MTSLGNNLLAKVAPFDGAPDHFERNSRGLMRGADIALAFEALIPADQASQIDVSMEPIPGQTGQGETEMAPTTRPDFTRARSVLAFTYMPSDEIASDAVVEAPREEELTTDDGVFTIAPLIDPTPAPTEDASQDIGIMLGGQLPRDVESPAPPTQELLAVTEHAGRETTDRVKMALPAAYALSPSASAIAVATVESALTKQTIISRNAPEAHESGYEAERAPTLPPGRIINAGTGPANLEPSIGDGATASRVAPRMPVVEPPKTLALHNPAGTAPDTPTPARIEPIAAASNQERDESDVVRDTKITDVKVQTHIPPSTRPAVLQQIGSAIKSEIAQDAISANPATKAPGTIVKTLELRLTPENLGPVVITMSMSGDTMKLTLRVTSPDVAGDLEKGKVELSRMLFDSGCSLDEFVVQTEVIKPNTPVSQTTANQSMGQEQARGMFQQGQSGSGDGQRHRLGKDVSESQDRQTGEIEQVSPNLRSGVYL